MFSAILKILPRLDAKDLDKMQKALQSRFTKIAKGFGKGLMNVITGGGIVGLGLMLTNKLLNPLKETQEAIDRLLASSSDTKSLAEHFGTTTGNLVKLHSLGAATGLDTDSLNTLIQKYQTAVAEAKADPKKDTAVRNFTGYQDTVTGFFDFIQGLQKMSKDDQILVQKQVFGDKAILKLADFLQQDFGKLLTRIGGPTTGQLGAATDKMAFIKGASDILEARRNLQDIMNKSNKMNLEMAFTKDESERIRLGRENRRIGQYQMLSGVQNSVDKLTALLEDKFYKEIKDWTKIGSMFMELLEKQAKLNNLKGVKGITNWILGE